MSIIISLFILLSFLFSVIALIFGLDRKASTTYAIICLFSGAWMASVLMAKTFADPFWAKIAFLCGFFIICSYYIFLSLYPKQIFFYSFKHQLCIATGALVSIYFFVFTDLMIVAINSNLEVSYGLLRYPFLLFVFGSLSFLIYMFLYGLKYYQSSDRSKMTYFLFGILFAVLLVLSNNLLLPILINSSQYSQYGTIAFPIMLAIHLYAIIRHQLLDIRIIIKRSVVYIFVMGVLSVLFFGLFISLAKLVAFSASEEMVLLCLVSFVIIALYPQFVSYINMVTDRFFFRQSYSFQLISSQYDDRLIGLQKSNDIIDYFLNTIIQTIRPKSYVLYFKNELGRIFQYSASGSHVISDYELPFINLFDSVRTVHSELIDCSNHSDIKEYDMMACIGSSRGVQVVVCLGPKSVELPYLSIDKQLLSFLLNRTAVALDHVFHYEDIIRYSQILSRFNSLFLSSKPIKGTLELFKMCQQFLNRDFFAEFIVTFNSNHQFEFLDINKPSSVDSMLYDDALKCLFSQLINRGESIIFESLSNDHSMYGLKTFIDENELKSLVLLKFDSGQGDVDYLLWFSKVWLEGSMIFSQLLSSFHYSLMSFYRRVSLYNKIVKTNQYNDDVLQSLLVGIVIFDENNCIKHINSEGYRVMGESINLQDKALDELSIDSNLWSYFKFALDVTSSESIEINLSQGYTLACSSVRLEYQGRFDTVCLLTDLTPFKQLERQLEQSDRLASLSNLSGGLSREIGHPIHQLKSFMKKLDLGWGDESVMFPLADSISTHVDHINSLCQSLLRLGKPSVVQFAPVNLTSLFKEAVGLIKGDLELNNVTIDSRIDPSVSIQGDSHQLLQVFLNVLMNAVESFDDNGGNIIFTICVFESNCKIIIQDFGLGYDAQKGENDVFDPFYTTKSKRNGLGLTIAKRIIEDHHGDIYFEPQDIGVIVSILFPLTKVSV